MPVADADLPDGIRAHLSVGAPWWSWTCSNGQCTFDLVSMTGGAMPSGGDSGAPVYTKSSVVGIRGMLIARNSQIMYLEKWSMISSTFGVSIWAP